MSPSIAALMLILAVATAQAADPVQINARADKACTAHLEPGHTPLQQAFPEAEFIYKATKAGAHVQSCEIRIPKDALLKAYGFCAMTSMLGSSDCSLNWDYASGRKVEITVISTPGATSVQPAVCGFVCTLR